MVFDCVCFWSKRANLNGECPISLMPAPGAARRGVLQSEVKEETVAGRRGT